MKENKTELQNKVNNLQVQLAARDEKVAEAVLSVIYWNLFNWLERILWTAIFKVTFVSSEQNLRHDLKMHFGHMHKDHKKNKEWHYYLAKVTTKPQL